MCAGAAGNSTFSSSFAVKKIHFNRWRSFLHQSKPISIYKDAPTTATVALSKRCHVYSVNTGMSWVFPPKENTDSIPNTPAPHSTCVSVCLLFTNKFICLSISLYHLEQNHFLPLPWITLQTFQILCPVILYADWLLGFILISKYYYVDSSGWNTICISIKRRCYRM